MFGYCLSALTDLEVKIRRRDANLGKIEAAVGWHFFAGAPSRIEITVMPVNPEQTEVSISSRSVIRAQFDWGRNRRIVRRFFDKLNFIVRRAEKIKEQDEMHTEPSS